MAQLLLSASPFIWLALAIDQKGRGRSVDSARSLGYAERLKRGSGCCAGLQSRPGELMVGSRAWPQCGSAYLRVHRLLLCSAALLPRPRRPRVDV